MAELEEEFQALARAFPSQSYPDEFRSAKASGWYRASGFGAGDHEQAARRLASLLAATASWTSLFARHAPKPSAILRITPPV